MRRDVLRVGIGRLFFELALGVALVGAEERTRWIATGIAVLGAVVGHFALRGTRRAFAAAHVALAAAAIPAHVEPRLATVALAAGLGFAIELAHVDLGERRRIREDVRTLRIPASLLVRRLGTVVIAAAAARASIPLLALAARPAALAPLLVALGALAMLVAGFGAGPGRPVTRPIDAAIFTLLALALALPADV